MLSTSLLVAIFLLNCVSNLSGSPQTFIAPGDSRQDSKIQRLKAQDTIERELPGREESVFQITLVAGQYFRASIEQWGADAVMLLTDPAGIKVSRSICREQERTTISFIAKSSGIHQLTITASEKSDSSFRYRLIVHELRPSKTQDGQQVSAERLFAEGDDLRGNQVQAESLRSAIRKYQQAGSLWRSVGNQQEQCHALRAIAEIYYSLGNYRLALDSYNRALTIIQKTTDFREMTGVLNGIGFVYISLGKQAMALKLSNQALDLARKHNDQRGEAQALNNLGYIYYYLSDEQKSFSCLNQAMQIWQAIKDRRGQAQNLFAVGYLYFDRGDMEKALNCHNSTLSLWQSVKDPRGQAQTYIALGMTRSVLGDTQASLDFHNKALDQFRSLGDHAGEATVLGSIGETYFKLGEFQKALNNFNQALKISSAIENRLLQDLDLSWIGRIYFLQNKKYEALKFQNRKLILDRMLNDHRLEAYTLRDIGRTYHSLGQTGKAFGYYTRALSLSKSVNDRRDQADILNAIGHLYYEKGDKPKALDYYNQALALNQATENRSGHIATLYNIARVQRDMNNLTESRAQIETSINMIESQRTNVVSQDLRASYLASEQQHYELYIDVLMRLHTQRPTEGFDAIALKVSEQARARSLLETLSESHADIRQGVNKELLGREHQIQQKLNTTANRQSQILNGKHTDQDAATIAGQIHQLSDDYTDVQSQIRAQSPRYANLTQPQPLDLRQIQQLLDDDILMLEYALGDDRSYVWAITPTTARAYELPGRTEIENATTHLLELMIPPQLITGQSARQYQAMADKASAEYAKESLALSQMLLGPVADELGKKRLVIIPSGKLQYLPFAALPEPSSGSHPVSVIDTKQITELQFLVNDHEITNLPSASVLSVMRRESTARKPATKALAVFADPVFDKDDERVKTAMDQGRNPLLSSNRRSGMITSRRAVTRSGTRLTEVAPALRAASQIGILRDGMSFARLAFTRREGMAIMAIVPNDQGVIWLDFDASRSTAMSSEMGQYRILHFATHALLNNEQPDLSGIVLSLVDKEGKPQDGFLRLNEIYNLQLSADLVVLSACQTGLGKQIKGEGLIGLTRGFMYAGASRVVASLWRVDDSATAELMQQFYSAILVDGLRPAAALQKAQKALLKERNRREPFCWAGFVLQGDWR